MSQLSSQRGYVLLLSVLVTGAVATATATAVLLLGLGISQSSFTAGQSVQAKALATACAEEAIQQLRNDITYSAGEQLSFSAGNCTIEAISGSGTSDRTITLSATVGQVVRHVALTVSDTESPVIVTQWHAVGP